MRQCNLGIALAVLLVTPAAAQLPALGAPRGIARFEIGGEFANTADQFLDGTSQPYRAQFSTTILGAAFYPELAPAQAQIAQLSGLGNYALSVGRASMQAQASVGTLRLGATLGVTSKLSVFGVIPIVNQQIKLDYGFDSTGANAGYNPADPTFGTAAGVAFLDSLGTTVDTLAARLGSGFYAGNPTEEALAQVTYTYLSSLDSLYASSPFVPLATSAAGVAMTGAVGGMQANLAALGIPSFGQPLPLPDTPLTASAYQQFLTLSTVAGGDIAAQPFTNYSSFLLGDIELGGVYTLVDRWNRPGQPGGLRVAVRALVRLPTSYQPLPNNFVSLPTGSGQTDLQASLVADVGGGRFGARFEGTYNDQLSMTVDRRVTLPSQPIPWANRLASVREDPGNELLVSAQPYFQLVPGLAIMGVVRYWSHGADAVEYASSASAVPGVSASDLAVDTQRSATVVGGGLSYAPATKGATVPMDAFWLYEAVVSASGGVVPKAATIRMGLRVPIRLWAAPPQ